MEISTIAFGLALMIQAAPPERLAALPAFPGWAETAEERGARYVEIERAARDVAFDPETVPLYPGNRGRALTVITLLAIAHHESGFARDVDLGPCYPVKDKTTGVVRCDGGRAACLMQLEVGEGWFYGYTRAELFADRKACFRAGLRHLIHTVGECRGKVAPERMFDAYASGSCRASKASRELFATVKKWRAARPVPLDAEIANDNARAAWRPSVLGVAAR